MHRHSRVATDARGVFLDVEPAFSDLFGWSAEQLAGRRIGELAHPEDLGRSLRTWEDLLENPGRSADPIRIRYGHREGHWIWVDVTCHNLLDTRGQMLVDMVDARDDVELLDSLAARDQLLGELAEMASVGVFHADPSGRMHYASPTLEKMTQVSGARSLGEQLAGVAERDRPGFTAAFARAAKGVATTVQVTSGLGGWRIRLSPLVAGTGAVRGVGGYVEADDERGTTLQGPACDPLTGAPILPAILDALSRLLTRGSPIAREASGPRSRRDGPEGIACIVISLAELGHVERRHGPGARDAVLSLAHLRIRDSLRSSDLVGRTGPDELTVVCPGVPDTTAALSVAHALLAEIRQPMTLSSGLVLTVGPGVGVGWTPRDGSQARDVLARSQAAARESAASEPSEPVLAQPAAPTG